jgi:methyl-accepting chemotaxis protein WspA
MKLRTKIMLSSGLPLLLATVVASSYQLFEFYQARVERELDHLRDAGIKIAQQVDATNSQALDAARIMALAQQSGMFGNRSASLAFAKEVLERFPAFTAAYVGYDPDADGQDAKPHPDLNPRAMDSAGRFIPYWFRDIADPTRIMLNPQIDMDTSYYYRGLRNRVTGKPEAEGIVLPGGISKLYVPSDTQTLKALQYIITEPYSYEGKYMVEQTAPIMINGEFAGLAGVDRSLEDVDDFLKKTATFKTEQYLLVSRRGRVISATMDPTMRTRLIEDTPYLEYLKPLYTRAVNESMILFTDPVTGEQRYLAGIRIPTGEWSLWISVTREEVLAPVWSRLRKVLFIVVLGALLALAISFRLVRSPIERVERAAAAAARVTAGDLTTAVSSEVQDESGVLLRGLGAMVTALSGLIGKIKASGVQLTSAASDIAAAANRQREITAGFGASTSQIAASITEISATSQELLQTMHEVASASNDTAAVANRGRGDLERMEATMQALASATASISSKLAVIAERANNIGAVVTTISKVAEQTNLLSLNAAIEAEKAGEYGLGFSVVAREIRRLADQTDVATLDIGRIVTEMRSAVSSGVMEMDRFGEQVRRGVSEATELGVQLAEIIEGVERLKPRFESAHQGMQAQVAGAGQISDAMLQLREVAVISGESSQALADTSGQLLQAVDALRAEIIRFQTA